MLLPMYKVCAIMLWQLAPCEAVTWSDPRAAWVWSRYPQWAQVFEGARSYSSSPLFNLCLLYNKPTSRLRNLNNLTRYHRTLHVWLSRQHSPRQCYYLANQHKASLYNSWLEDLSSQPSDHVKENKLLVCTISENSWNSALIVQAAIMCRISSSCFFTLLVESLYLLIFCLIALVFIVIMWI